MFTAIFLSLFLAAWLLLGFLPWLMVSVVTRGRAGLGMLPLCLLAGLVGGFAVPLLGKDDGQGIWISMLAALVASSALIAARKFSQHAPAPEASPERGSP